MLIYTILFISFFLLRILLSTNLKGKSFHDKKFVIIMAVLMGIVLGFRGPEVGVDTKTYINIFKDIRKMSFYDVICYGYDVPHVRTQYHGIVEFLFVVINKLISFVSRNPNLMFLVVGLATCLLFAKFIIENCDEYCLPTFILMCDFIFINAFNTMRQIFAISVGIQAFSLINSRKKYLRALLIIIIASNIHTSAIIYLCLFVIVFLAKTKQSYKLFKYCLCGCIFILQSLPLLAVIVSSFSKRYAFYLTTNIWNTKVGGIVILWCFEFGLVLWMYFKRFKISGSFEYSICIMIYLTLDILSIQISGISRIGWYFRVFLICFFPTALKFFPDRFSYVVRIVIYVLLGALYLNYTKNSVLAYSFFWN